MKQIRIAILLLLIPLCCVAFAALTKTTTIIELDAWIRVEAGGLDVGNAGDIHLSYNTILYLEIAYADADAQDGVEVSIEVSYGDDDWVLLTRPFNTPTLGTREPVTLVEAVIAGDISFDVSDSSELVPGIKWFIEDASEQLSESVRSKSEAANTVTLCHDILRNHNNGSSVWDTSYEYTFTIPAAFAYVRVLINNVDANADIFFTTRLSKVTGL